VKFVAAFVIASGELEAGPRGQREFHRALADRLAARLGMPVPDFVSGTVTSDRDGARILLGPSAGLATKQQIEELVAHEFGDLGEMEFVFSA